MTHSASGVAWSKASSRSVKRLVSWKTTSYCIVGHRQHLSAPQFQRMAREMVAVFDNAWPRFEAVDWTDLDGLLDLCRDVVTARGVLLGHPSSEGRWARAYARMGWAERLALLDVQANRRASPKVWLLRAAVVQYCVAYDLAAPVWPAPKWPLNASFGSHDETILGVAAAQYDLWVVYQLLYCEPIVQMADQNGVTPLHHLAWRGDEGLVTILLTRGAAVDAADAAGRTPLSMALSAARFDCALVLLRAGGTSPLLPTYRALLRHHAEMAGDQVSVTVLDCHALEESLATPARDGGNRMRL